MKRIISLLASIAALTTSLVSQGQTPSRQIAVGYNKTVMLVFPAAIIDADRGSDQISVRIARKTPTVLKVKASVKDFDTTNLTIYTEDGRMYMTTVHYDPGTADAPYRFDASTEGCSVTPLTSSPRAMTTSELKDLAAVLVTKTPHLRHPAQRTAGIKLSLANIWYKDERLFFQLVLSNHSSIPYDIAFAKFYQRDNSRGKRTAVVEKELTPVDLTSSKDTRVESGGQNSVVVVFDKFTLAEGKHLAVEFFENGGDRHLALRIKGSRILHATPLP